MTILITGGEGFLGKHLQEELRNQGFFDVTTVRSSQYDLTSQEDADNLIYHLTPDCVFHLAAQVGGIGINQVSAGKFWYDNLMMGMNVLEACRYNKVRKLIIVGTACSYPKFPKTIPFVESELFDGYPEETNAPYGIAKRALIAGAQAYAHQYKMNVVNLIPTNIYGPGDNFNLETSHVIPALIKKFHHAKRIGASEVEVWGTGKASRDFIYVKDVAEALVLAMRCCARPEPLNIGSGEEINVKSLVEMISKHVGYSGKIRWLTEKPDGQPRRALNSDKARLALGWRPQTKLDIGLSNTVDWYIKEFWPKEALR